MGLLTFSINRISRSLLRISKNLLVLVVQSFSFFDLIYSRNSLNECECVDGNASDVFKGDDLYWCCKAPHTECTNHPGTIGRICQGKKLHLSQQCHDDTKITVYQRNFAEAFAENNYTGIRITHPRCNHYPTSSRGDFISSTVSYISRSFIDVCRDNRYNLNSAKIYQGKSRNYLGNLVWAEIVIPWQI